jgi:hypothetical protein
MAKQNPTQQTAGSTDQNTANPLTFNANDFNDNSTKINNQYFPLKPGTTFAYSSADGSSTDTEIVTNTPKKIEGVNCVVVDDTVREGGTVTEHTLDYYAQDKKGNVWYFGEDSQTIQNGKVVSTEGSWLAGQVPEGGDTPAQPGIIMEAKPQLNDTYNQENALPVAEDAAEVLSLKASASVPFGDFSSNLLLTLETSTVEPGAAEVKYYAKGVGEVSERDLVTQDDLGLVSVTSDPNASQLVQAMASFGASDAGSSSPSSTQTANDQSMHQVLAAHGQA